MENEARLKWKSLGEKILEASRSELYLSMRFLDMAFAELKFEMNLSTFLIGTEGITLQYNPRFLVQRYQDSPIKVNRAFLHTILHCLFRHMYLREEREEELFHLACDITVEYLIDQLDYPSTKWLISDERIEIYNRLMQQLKVVTAEGVYQYLIKAKLGSRELVQLQTAFLVDDHQFWEAKKKGNEPNESKSPKKDSEKDSKKDSEKDSEKYSEKERNKNSNKNQDSPNHDQSIYRHEDSKKQANRWRELSEKTKINAETFSKQAGDEVKQLLLGIQVANREKYNYKEFLRKFAVLVENSMVDDNSFDYGLYSYGKELFDNILLMEPLEYRESYMIEEFVIAIDTSGSCSEDLIKRFVEQTFHILKSIESHGRKLKLHILQCDNEVKEDVLIENLEQLSVYQEKFEIKGFGGTDYRPVFSYIEELRGRKQLSQLKGLLYFTDGYGIFPKKRTDYETAFIFIGEDNYEGQVPPWAMKLVLDEKDL